MGWKMCAGFSCSKRSRAASDSGLRISRTITDGVSKLVLLSGLALLPAVHACVLLLPISRHISHSSRHPGEAIHISIHQIFGPAHKDIQLQSALVRISSH